MSENKTERRILIVDDHPVVREGLGRLINHESDMSVCAEADSPKAALEAISEFRPDLAVVDITLKVGNGLDLIKSIRSRYPNVKTLVLSIHHEANYADRAWRSGADGYVMKDEAPASLLGAIRTVLSGNKHYSEQVLQAIEKKALEPDTKDESPIERLTNRELEVFRLIGHGQQTRVIAQELNVSIKTVESHRENIKRKLGISNAPQLVQQAVQWVADEAS